MNRNSIIKGLSVWALFIFFHFGYKLLPSHLFTLLGCPFESVFQHMKMAFFSYTIVSVAEFIISRKKDRTGSSFWMSRLLSAVFLSLIVYLVWYIYPVLFGLIESSAGEIVYSNIILVICIVVTLSLELLFHKVQFPVLARIAIVFLFITASINYSILAFRTSPVGLFEKVEHSHGAGSEEGHHDEDH